MKPETHKLLDIKIPPLKEGFVLPVGNSEQTFYSLKVEDVFNPELISFFAELGFIPQYALIFHHTPYSTVQPIHVDNNLEQFRCSINWVFCDHHLLRWYEPKPGATPIPTHVSPVHGGSLKDVPYVTLAEEDAVVIDETSDKGPMLVSIGNIFHKAVNLSDADRWSVILKFTLKSTPSWDYVVEKLSPYIIESRDK